MLSAILQMHLVLSKRSLDAGTVLSRPLMLQPPPTPTHSANAATHPFNWLRLTAGVAVVCHRRSRDFDSLEVAAAPLRYARRRLTNDSFVKIRSGTL